jgi:chromosome segregation ATPase
MDSPHESFTGFDPTHELSAEGGAADAVEFAPSEDAGDVSASVLLHNISDRLLGPREREYAKKVRELRGRLAAKDKQIAAWKQKAEERIRLNPATAHEVALFKERTLRSEAASEARGAQLKCGVFVMWCLSAKKQLIISHFSACFRQAQDEISSLRHQLEETKTALARDEERLSNYESVLNHSQTKGESLGDEVARLQAEKIMLLEYCQDTQRQLTTLTEERDSSRADARSAFSRADQYRSALDAAQKSLAETQAHLARETADRHRISEMLASAAQQAADAEQRSMAKEQEAAEVSAIQNELLNAIRDANRANQNLESDLFMARDSLSDTQRANEQYRAVIERLQRELDEANQQHHTVIARLNSDTDRKESEAKAGIATASERVTLLSQQVSQLTAERDALLQARF